MTAALNSADVRWFDVPAFEVPSVGRRLVGRWRRSSHRSVGAAS